jgi:hypothetical protein
MSDFASTPLRVDQRHRLPDRVLRHAVAVCVCLCAGSAAAQPFVALPPIDQPIAEEAGVQTIALADVDQDGVVDLLSVNEDEELLSIRLGAGNGTFGAALDIEAGDFPNAVAVADLTSPFDSAAGGDADGVPDVIVVDDIGGVQIFLGLGDGSFDFPDQSFDDLDSIELEGVSVADFDGNGRDDLALLDALDGVYFLCNSDGTLEPCPTPVVFLDEFIFQPSDIAVGNFDGGAIDVAVTDGDTGELFIVSGFGDGTFEAEVTPIVVDADGAGAVAMRVADIDGDGRDDIVVASHNILLEESGLTVFYGNDGEADLRRADFDGPEIVSALVLVDFDLDGALDVVTVGQRDLDIDGDSALLPGDGNGGFAAPMSAPGLEAIVGGRAVESADLNGDTRLDLVALVSEGQQIVAALNDPAIEPPCVGDCDGNGTVSIAELIRGVNIALGNAALDDCPSFDRNDSGTVEVNELIAAVNNALSGCPV